MSLLLWRTQSPQYVPSTPYLRRSKADSPFSVVPEIIYSPRSPQKDFYPKHWSLGPILPAKQGLFITVKKRCFTSWDHHGEGCSSSEQYVPRSPRRSIPKDNFLWKTPSPAWRGHRGYIRQISKRKSQSGSFTPLLQYSSPATRASDQIVPGTPDQSLRNVNCGENLISTKSVHRSESNILQQKQDTPRRKILVQQRRNSPPVPKCQRFDLFSGDEIFVT